VAAAAAVDDDDDAAGMSESRARAASVSASSAAAASRAACHITHVTISLYPNLGGVDGTYQFFEFCAHFGLLHAICLGVYCISRHCGLDVEVKTWVHYHLVFYLFNTK
jgi:hypothetical protein